MLLMVFVVAGCTDPYSASKVLRNNGYTRVEIVGYGWFVCGRDDHYSTEFKATSPTGQRVEGVVCSGLMKGSTIRFY